jgi:serine-threonine kinase receptor-associated protein
VFVVSFSSLAKIQEVRVPTTVYSASLHPAKTVFVCGGMDFKMYKFDYASGAEIGEKDDLPFFPFCDSE